MSAPNCPDLELLFAELEDGAGEALQHAQHCEHCSEILQEHRSLERELFRLSNPFPPSSFVQQVMAKVAGAPEVRHADIRVGAAILFGAVVLCLGTLFASNGAAYLGAQAVSALITTRSLGFGVTTAVSALWATAALPMFVSLSLVLLGALLGLRRLVRSPVLLEAKISS